MENVLEIIGLRDTQSLYRATALICRCPWDGGM